MLRALHRMDFALPTLTDKLFAMEAGRANVGDGS